MFLKNTSVDFNDERTLKEAEKIKEATGDVTPEKPNNEKGWIEEVEQKVQILKNLEEEKCRKKSEQEEALKKIEALKEELANQQLAYEISSEELEKLEEQWVKEKEELAELIIK